MKDRSVVQSEALNAIANENRAGLVISMRVGKSRIGIMDMVQKFTIHSLFLVVAPKPVHLSWKDELKKLGVEWLLEHIIFTTYQSLSKCLNKEYIDTVYLDECHNLRLSHNAWLKEYVIKHKGRTIGLTGTYPKALSSESGKMCNAYCPCVYTYELKDAVDDSILNDYEIVIHKIKLTEKKVIKRTGKYGSFFVSEKDTYDYWTDKIRTLEEDEEASPELLKKARLSRMRALMEMPGKELYAGCLLEEQTDKTIIFANTQEQADRLCPNSYHAKNEASDKNLEDFKAGVINKLSCVHQLNMGITVPDLKVGILLHASSKSINAGQRISRMLSLQQNEKATIHILCYEGTIDEQWIKKALVDFHQNKITWQVAKFYPNLHYNFHDYSG